jgi:hypothetical protein
MVEPFFRLQVGTAKKAFTENVDGRPNRADGPIKHEVMGSIPIGG